MTSLKLSLAAAAGGLFLAAGVAGTAYAGPGGCSYGAHARTAQNTDVESTTGIEGKQSKIAETEISTPVTTPVVVIDEPTDDAAGTVVAADGTTSQD